MDELLYGIAVLYTGVLAVIAMGMLVVLVWTLSMMFLPDLWELLRELYKALFNPPE